MNCDRIASSYRFLEYGAFGRALERRRFEFLAQTRYAQHALMLGEGDGRFLKAFLETNPQATVDYVDSSANMLALAKDRAGPHHARVRFYREDALRWIPPRDGYDLIVTHFFLDCFNETDIPVLVKHLASHAKTATWIVSDFHQPAKGFAAIRAASWLWTLYGLFRITTGLQTRALADHRPALAANGFRLERKVTTDAGLLISELWKQCS